MILSVSIGRKKRQQNEEEKKRPKKKHKKEKKKGSSKKKNKSKRTCNWVFTANNSVYLPSGLPDFCKYFVAQVEVAPTTGTKHVQGYFQLKKRMRFHACLAKLQELYDGPTPRMEPARGSSYQAAHYCMKPEKGCGCTHCVKALQDPPRS